MGVQSLYTAADQKSMHDDVLRNRDILNAQQYKPTLEKIEKFGSFRTGTWMPKLYDGVDRMEQAMNLRDSSGALQTVDAEEVAEDLAELDEWFTEGELALAIAVDAGVQGARALQAQLRRAPGTQATFRDLNRPLDIALNALQLVPDLTTFELTADYLDRGRALQSSVEGERSELHGNQMGITAGALAFHAALEDVAALFERHNLSVQLASVRLKEELPQLDLRYIRASLARRRPYVAAATAAAAAAATPDPQPPSDSGL
jgi:hypothetical protein